MEDRETVHGEEDEVVGGEEAEDQDKAGDVVMGMMKIKK